MAQFVPGGFRTYSANAALAQYCLVKMIAGAVVTNGALISNCTVDYCGAGDDPIGVTQAAALVANSPICVLHRNAQDTIKLIANGAISGAAKCYPAANGKVSATGTGPAVAMTLEPATADGDVIECRFINGGAFSGDDAANLLSGGNAGAIPPLYTLTVPATAGTYAVATPSRKVKIIDWWIQSRDTTASNVTLQNGASAAATAIAKGTVADVTVRGTNVFAAQNTVTAGTAINVTTSGNAALDVFVLCQPIP